MNDNDAAKALLDALAEEAKADLPGEGEFTTSAFCEEMAKRGLTITRIIAERMMKKWSSRMGRTADGHSARIFKTPV